MVIESFVLTEVIIQEKRGSEDPQWTVCKLSYYLELLLRSFLGELFNNGAGSGAGAGASSTTGSGAGASSTTGSTTGLGAGAGAAGALPPIKSPNLDIAFIEYF